VLVAVDGRAAGLIGIADAPRETSEEAIGALHEGGVEVVMLSGDNQATAERIAGQLGIDTVIAEVLRQLSPRRTSESRSVPARMSRSRRRMLF
jgi:Cu2+-exporting ATPase